MRRDSLLLCGALLALAGWTAAEAPAPAIGAGTTLTAGSRGYRRLSLYGDAYLRRGSLEPYAWGEYVADTYVNQFSLGGGAWKELEDGERVKGGLGLTRGRIKSLDEPSSSVILEAGAEKDFETPTLGADYRFISGSIGATSSPRSGEAGLSGKVRAKGGRVEADPFTSHEFSGYARVLAGRSILGLRLTLARPSYAGTILSETLSLRIPASERVWVTPAVAFEQDRGRDVRGVYFSLGLYYAFGSARAPYAGER